MGEFKKRIKEECEQICNLFELYPQRYRNRTQSEERLMEFVAEIEKEFEEALNKSLNNATHKGCLIPIYALREKWFGDLEQKPWLMLT